MQHWVFIKTLNCMPHWRFQMHFVATCHGLAHTIVVTAVKHGNWEKYYKKKVNLPLVTARGVMRTAEARSVRQTFKQEHVTSEAVGFVPNPRDTPQGVVEKTQLPQFTRKPRKRQNRSQKERKKVPPQDATHQHSPPYESGCPQPRAE